MWWPREPASRCSAPIRGGKYEEIISDYNRSALNTQTTNFAQEDCGLPKEQSGTHSSGDVFSASSQQRLWMDDGMV